MFDTLRVRNIPTVECMKTKDQLDVTCNFYFTSYMLNMFRTLIYPLSGACEYSVELPHWSCVLGSMCVGDSVLQAEACNTDTTPTQPHRNTNTHRTKNTRPMW